MDEDPSHSVTEDGSVTKEIAMVETESHAESTVMTDNAQKEERKARSSKTKGAMCYAWKCGNYKNAHSKARGISFHKFPNPETQRDRYNAWKKNCHREPGPSSLLCSDHFEDQMFDRTGQTTRLRSEAVPTKFVLPPHLQCKQVKRTTRTSQKAGTPPTLVKEQRSDKSDEMEKNANTDHTYPGSPSTWKKKLSVLEEKLEETSQKFRNALKREKRAKTYCQKQVEELYENNLINAELKNKLESLGDIPWELFKQDTGCYNLKQKDFAISLHLQSPKAYDYLRQSDFPLPHPRTLRKWMESVSGSPGINDAVTQKLASKRKESSDQFTAAMAGKFDDIPIIEGPTFPDHTVHHFTEMDLDRIYMDYNATTPVEPNVIQAISEALNDAWGNPSSNYVAGVKAKCLINQSRVSVARMVGGEAEDIIFTSGGTEANNLVLHTAMEYFRKNCRAVERGEAHQNGWTGLPHIITSNVEHDSIKLVAERLEKEGKADVTFVPVSKVTGRVEAEDVMAAVRPNTCLITVMLANNETGVIMPLQDICQSVKSLNKQPERLRILLHTDAAQALGKIPVDACELGVDYLTIVGHKFYAPRIGALYVNGPGTRTPLHPMLFGGGQERNFRPGTENTPMIAGLGKAAELVTANLSEYESHMRSTKLYLENRLQTVFKDRIRYNSHFPGSAILPNTCNVSILGQTLQGWRVLSNCKRLLASVGAACHSDSGNRPSHILLSCGVPTEVAANALRLSVGRGTSQADVDAVVEDLRKTVELLERMN